MCLHLCRTGPDGLKLGIRTWVCNNLQLHKQIKYRAAFLVLLIAPSTGAVNDASF